MNRRRKLRSLACGLLVCLVAPPVGCGSAGSGEVTDDGGCNGGRSLPGEEEGDETSSSGGSTSTSVDATSESTSSAGVCGDGVVDEGEGCDDGNEDDEDACPSGAQGACAGEAACGDGLVWAGQEECDDGNTMNGDGCEEDCTETPTAECGNGVMEAGEGCDDGNAVDEDGCPSGAQGGCQPASCGDGIVWSGTEGCDDGNTDDTDGCPSGAAGMCAAAASCGDGIVWSGTEGCDDGNTIDEDECPSGATGQCKAAASCGDGLVWSGTEECDDGNEDDIDACNDDCAAPRWVFITSKGKDNGNLGGVAGADAYCQMLADGAGLGGTYMAWLTGSDPATAPAMRFASAGFAGWYMLPGDPPTPVARGWADLVGPSDLQAAIVRDEAAADVGDANAWTNTRADGTQLGADHCSDWGTNDGDLSGGTGRSKSGIVSDAWTDNAEYACNSGARLYCFQVGV
ncbi:MAG: DUF4215 domain-containing protein [Myxococcales bacterium]|nr:DUF4215 domain-containing protein [Myxococcales bacterium]